MRAGELKMNWRDVGIESNPPASDSHRTSTAQELDTGAVSAIGTHSDRAAYRHLGVSTGGMSNAERLRTLRTAARALGLCGECRLRPSASGLASCTKCLDAHRERKARYRRDLRCACGGIRRSGRTDCAACAERVSVYVSARRLRDIADGRRPECRAASAEANRSACRPCLDNTSARVKAVRERRGAR